MHKWIAAFAFVVSTANGQQLNDSPSRAFGQKGLSLTSVSPNLVEGRELFNPSSAAVDVTASPAILYVADTGNNRILAWRGAFSLSKGAPADAVIGQRDLTGTTPQGPGTGLSTGLNAPTGVLVDSQGNLYVADAGNNRILRYPRPLSQTEDVKFPDMVIGQANFNGNTANAGGISASSVAFTVNRIAYHVGMAFDQNGNLWVSDAGNNRVLRYPLGALRPGSQPQADLVLGQFGFNSNSNNSSRDPRIKVAMTSPSGLAFDPAGRLFVCDAHGRVLVFNNLTTGAAAIRVMGVVIAQQGQTLPPVSESTLGVVISNQQLAPEAVFFIGNTPFVVDTPTNRIVRYDPFDAWPSEATIFSPPGRQFLGQLDANSFRPNVNRNEPSEVGFNRPVAAAVTNSDVFIVDGGNHRVMGFPIGGGSITAANKLFGQAEFYQNAPNFVEGKELWVFNGFTPGVPGSSSDGAGVAIDNRSNPPHLYIADTYNHRILGFRDARNPGERADIVIGQRDLRRAQINDPTDRVDQVTPSGLYLPAGLAVDSFGNLYVADSGNGRILRFQRPFESNGPYSPDLVLGQLSTTSKLTDATARTMSRPYGLAFTSDGSLYASDLAHNRVLFFRKPSGRDFEFGQAAEKVLGQAGFTTTDRGNTINRLSVPHGIATDSDDRLYVADSSNNRVLIFDSVNNLPPDPSPVLSVQGLQSAHGVFVNPSNGEMWVAVTGSSRARHYPPFQRLVFNPNPDYEIPMANGNYPLALTTDSFGNLVVVEAVNRVTFYFPGLRLSNAGNGSNRFSPAVYAVAKPATGVSFGNSTILFDQVPFPPMATVLGDIQVTVNGVPSPIHFVSPGQINFLMPQSAPVSGSAEVTVTRSSTGQIFGTSSIQMSQVAPAFLTSTGDGRGQIVAINQADGAINSPVNPASAGTFISLFGTGLGNVPGQPSDGMPAAGAFQSNGTLVVQVNNEILPRENIVYSGLTPTLVSVWQLTFKIPENLRPGPSIPVAATLNSIPTNQGTVTTIAVKP